MVSDIPYFSLRLDFREVRAVLELGKPTLVEKQGVRLPTKTRNAVTEEHKWIKNEHENWQQNPIDKNRVFEWSVFHSGIKLRFPRRFF